MMCAVGFTAPMLFEENKGAYHLMLQEFTNSKGYDAFFDVFDEVLLQLDSSRDAQSTSNRLPGMCSSSSRDAHAPFEIPQLRKILSCMYQWADLQWCLVLNRSCFL